MRTQLLSGAWLLLRVNVYFVYLDGYVQRVGSGAFTLGFGLEFGYVFLDTRIINGTHVLYGYSEYRVQYGSIF